MKFGELKEGQYFTFEGGSPVFMVIEANEQRIVYSNDSGGASPGIVRTGNNAFMEREVNLFPNNEQFLVAERHVPSVEKLPPFSKVLLATQSINYMTYNLSTVIDGLQLTQPSLYASLLEQHKDFLNEVVSDLSELAEKIGDHLNANDMVMPIDQRITNAAFAVMQGYDNVDE